MRRVIIIVVAVIVITVGAIVGVGYMAISDEESAMDALSALQSQISDIGKEEQADPSLAQLQQMSVQLSDIRSELFDLPSRHRLGSMFFSSVQMDVDEVINTEQNILIKINLKIGSR